MTAIQSAATSAFKQGAAGLPAAQLLWKAGVGLLVRVEGMLPAFNGGYDVLGPAKGQ